MHKEFCCALMVPLSVCVYFYADGGKGVCLFFSFSQFLHTLSFFVCD